MTEASIQDQEDNFAPVFPDLDLSAEESKNTYHGDINANFHVPTFSIEAEESVLGGLLIDNEQWNKISDKIAEHDFYRSENRVLFNVIKALAEENTPFDVLTISELLKNKKLSNNEAVLSRLASIARNTPSSKNVESYAKIVTDRAVLRDMVRVSHEIKVLATTRDNDFNVSDVVGRSEKMLSQVNEKLNASKKGLRSDQDILIDVMDRLEEVAEQDEGMTGVTSGFEGVDEITSGWQNSDLIILAGRPAMGKTSIAVNLCDNAAKGGHDVAIFSLEMPAEQLMRRILSSESDIEQNKFRNAAFTNDEWATISQAANSIAATEGRLYIDDTPTIKISEMRAKIRRLNQENEQAGRKPISLIMVDYLQLMGVENKKVSRMEQISEISGGLKSLAKELNIPIIALSQLSRNLESRPNKRPILSDLRESGSIEQDADIITFIYRDEVYNPETTDIGIGEFIIGKHRNGSVGIVRLQFMASVTRFQDIQDNYDDFAYSD